MRGLEPLAMLLSMSLSSVPRRWGSAMVVVVGMAGVVGVMVSVSAIVGGLGQTLLATGSASRAIVLRNGASAEISSLFSSEEAAQVMNAPGIARTSEGEVAATTDMLVGVNLAKRDGVLGSLSVRGVSPQTFTIRPQIFVIEGRAFEPGLRELIVGRNAQTEFAGLEIGKGVELRDSLWTIVGSFSSGDSLESGFLADIDTLLSAYHRTQITSVTVQLESEAAFSGLEAALTGDPTLDVQVLRESDYYRGQSEKMQAILKLVSQVIVGIMAVGAVFAALNSTYSAVSARALEIATLRAIGFGVGTVVAAVLAESVLLASLGGFIGAVGSWLVFGGDTLSMGDQLSSIVFQTRITPALLGAGVAWGAMLGLLGALFPSLRAARRPVAHALRGG